MNWLRIVLCGLLAGGVWSALSIVAIVAVGDVFFSSVISQPPNRLGGDAHLTLIAANLVSGIWAVWLFTLVRIRQRRTVGAVVVSAFAWWVIVTQQSIKWLVLSGFAVGPVFGLGVATYIAMLLSVMAGALAYERQVPSVSGKG